MNIQESCINKNPEYTGIMYKSSYKEILFVENFVNLTDYLSILNTIGVKEVAFRQGSMYHIKTF